MEWNVYIFNHQDKVETYNIFNHGGFLVDFKKALLDNDNKKDFEEALDNILHYHFWGRAEWEVVVKPWVGHGIETKVDVYNQVVKNWNVFLDYCWNFRNKKKGVTV